MEARNSGDAATIGQASQRVIALALVEMAKLRLDAKAYDEASKLCRESLEFEDTPETRLEIAIASFYAGKFSEAISEASAATEKGLQNSLAWTIKGEAQLKSEDYSGAAAALTRALEIKLDPEPAYALGIAQLGMADKEASAAAFSQFLELVGDSGWSRVLVGRAYQEHGYLQEAEKEFRKALLLDPATPNAHYFWAISAMQENGWSANEEVYSHFRAELHLNPRHFESNYMMGYLASTARNYGESDRYLRLASQLKPSVPETWVLLGLSAQRRRANEASETYFRKAIELSKNLNLTEHFEIRKAYFGLGRLLMASGRTKEGQGLLDRAREIEAQVLAEDRRKLTGPEEQEKTATKGSANPYIPESDSSRQSLMSALSANGSSANERPASKARAGIPSPSDSGLRAERHLGVVLGASLNDLATAEALQEKYQEALHHYREAARWDPQIPGLKRNLGLAAYFEHELAEAIRLLAKVVQETPGDERARTALALAYFAQGEFGRTVQTITPMGDRALQDPQVGFALAKSLAETGNKKEATRTLLNLEKTSESSSLENLIRLGEIWKELGDEERAAQAFRRALALDPENRQAKCALHLTDCSS